MSRLAEITADLPVPAATFLAWMEFQKGASEATVAAYAVDILEFETYLRGMGASLERPSEITRQMVQGFSASLFRQGMARSSMARKLSALRSLFRHLLRLHKIEADPCSGVRNPKQDQRHPAMLNVDQVFSLLDEKPAEAVAAHPGDMSADDVFLLRDKALLELLYGSGLRISEALGLNVNDIRPESGHVQVMGKGSKERVVPKSPALSKQLMKYRTLRDAYLKEYPSRHKNLFLSKNGKPLTDEAVARMLKH